MSHYIANLRDIEFCLFDLLGREKVMGIAPNGQGDRETSVGMLEEMKRLCENDLSESFVEGDRVGTVFNKETGKIEQVSDKDMPKKLDTDQYRYFEGATRIIKRIIDLVEYNNITAKILIVLDSLGNLQSIRELQGIAEMGAKGVEI
jgi:hypothetical protein